ncbi:multicopper oxidase domain-containing protein [Corynebacterium sputi]|uniref:multicopper oxidase domain-containing protein n=1 Tax=Corynebacterium sputi TaxID=489915 RepID=UPI00041C001B|nr:multicopper oxidase domain-containing protein [Corynebacterium sputi]
MTVIAGDGGLLEQPVQPQSPLRLAPGERAETLVELRPGQTVRLRSEEVDLGGVAVPGVMGGGDSFDVLELRGAEVLTPSPEATWPRSVHAEEDELHESEVSRTRSFMLAGREINGERMDMQRIDEVVHVGDTEIWEIRSQEPVPHSFHIHDVQFLVLSIDEEAPLPEMAGRKDTVYLEPNRDYRLLMRFEDFADPHHAYMYHCHMLLHEDEGMMGQFVVIDPGDEVPERLPPVGGPHGRGHH